METLPDPGALPADQPPPTGTARPAAHFPGQHLPGQPGAQHEEDSGQRGAIGHAGAAHPPAAPTWGLGQQRLKASPEPIIDQGLGHARPYQAAGARTSTSMTFETHS